MLSSEIPVSLFPLGRHRATTGARQGLKVRERNPILTGLCCLVPLLIIMAGCAVHEKPRRLSPRYADLINHYSKKETPLQLHKLGGVSPEPASLSGGPHEFFVFVHPAYSVFFRDPGKDDLSQVKFDLMRMQFELEKQKIVERAGSGNVVIIVVPGDYASESFAPTAYVSYLNSITGDRKVYYVLSETASSGTLPVNDMVALYVFLQSSGARKIMIGGGFIGRCQREFVSQLTNYIDKSMTIIVPELSTISPDDINDKEATRILRGLEQRDYTPIKLFMDKKNSVKADSRANSDE
jgi:hypothetical protein